MHKNIHKNIKETQASIFDKVELFTKEHNLIKPHSTIIVGLSGGPDSVFLAYFFNSIKDKYNLKLVAANLDHQWRPESAKEVDFCRNIAENLNIDFESAQAQDIILTRSISSSKEEIGRYKRRAFYEKLYNKYNASAIALGHHLNDQQETFFIRLIRGASLTGLSSIWPKSQNHNIYYIHPLLSITKSDILDYLDKNNIKYIIDPTNISPDYLRNRIRLNIIPALENIDNRFDKNFNKALNSIQESEKFIEDITNKTFDNITCIIDNTLYLDINKFLEIDSFLHIRILLKFLCTYNVYFTPTQALFKEIIRFFNNKSSKTHQIYPTWKLIKYKNLISIKK